MLTGSASVLAISAGQAACRASLVCGTEGLRLAPEGRPWMGWAAGSQAAGRTLAAGSSSAAGRGWGCAGGLRKGRQRDCGGAEEETAQSAPAVGKPSNVRRVTSCPTPQASEVRAYQTRATANSTSSRQCVNDVLGDFFCIYGSGGGVLVDRFRNPSNVIGVTHCSPLVRLSSASAARCRPRHAAEGTTTRFLVNTRKHPRVHDWPSRTKSREV